MTTLSPHVRELAGLDVADLEPPFLRVSVVRETVVVLSRSREPAREVNLPNCAADAVPVVARPSGGGAVLLSPGVVAATLVDHSPRGRLSAQPHFDRYCAAVVRALAACGARGVDRRGVSDVCLGDRKVAGSAVRLAGTRVVYQVSLLVDADVTLMERYLHHPSRAPDYRRGRGHRDFVVTLREAGAPATRAEAARLLAIELRTAMA